MFDGITLLRELAGDFIGQAGQEVGSYFIDGCIELGSVSNDLWVQAKECCNVFHGFGSDGSVRKFANDIAILDENLMDCCYACALPEAFIQPWEDVIGVGNTQARNFSFVGDTFSSVQRETQKGCIVTEIAFQKTGVALKLPVLFASMDFILNGYSEVTRLLDQDVDLTMRRAPYFLADNPLARRRNSEGMLLDIVRYWRVVLQGVEEVIQENRTAVMKAFRIEEAVNETSMKTHFIMFFEDGREDIEALMIFF